MKKLEFAVCVCTRHGRVRLTTAGDVHAQGKTTIGVALPQDDNPFYIAMIRGVRARAQELGWDVVAVSSNEDKLKQINGVQDLVARGVKGILISPIDATGVNAAYDAAAAGKVPIVSVARGSTSPNQTLARRDGREADRPRHRRMDRQADRRQGQGRHAARTVGRSHLPQSRRGL